jgi:predicted PhzF superfamily epimerase YddE/YHI9
MAPSVLVHVLRVFVGEDGGGGNPLGVVLDGPAVPEDRRQALAAFLGFSETVFVEPDLRLRIYTPATELPFAGHPLVGAAWLVGRERGAVQRLHPPAGTVDVRTAGPDVFVTGRPEWATAYDQVQLATPAEVDALSGPPPGHDLVAAWAWDDEARGAVRVRVFPIGIGIAEDEATGANAVLMASLLRRPLRIHQGVGSLISAVPLDDGRVEIGGRVELVEEREVALPVGEPAA